MTIDAGNSFGIIRTIIRSTDEPQGVVSADAEVKKYGYERRLFLCPHLQKPMTGADPSKARDTRGVCRPRNFYFVGAEYIQPSETAEGLNVFNPYEAAVHSNAFGSNDGFGRPIESVGVKLWLQAKLSNLLFECSTQENGGKNCFSSVENVEKLCKWLALVGKIHYNKKLYNVVGSRFMQGFAGLRNVAEVVITNFVYLKTPHIANSKGIIFAQ